MRCSASRSPFLPGLLRLAWARYLSALRRDPLLTKSATSGLLSLLSSLLAARLARTPPRSSAALQELTAGLALRGPAVHAFHTLLDRVVFAAAPSQTAPPVVLAKLALDQLLFAPALTAAYLHLRGAFADEPLRETAARVRRELWTVMLSNWAVWVPANLVGYAAVPLDLRVAWGSVVGVLWTTILIRKVAAEKARADAAVAAVAAAAGD